MMKNRVVEILLVEDNQCDAELTQRALKECDVPAIISIVKDGEEAYDFLLGQGAFSDRDVSENPKVILLDLKMPKVGGLECLQNIRKNVRTSSIPVVVFSSSAEEFDVMKCYVQGVSSFVVKPVDHDTYFETVVSIGHYWLSLNRIPSLAALPAADR